MFKKIIIFALFVGLFMATTYLRADGSLGLYGIVLLIYLFSKMILSFLYRPFIGLAKDYKVAVVIPTYNEDGEGLIDTLISVIHQDYPIAEIFIVDDGSSDTTGFDKVKQFVADNAEMCHHVVLHRLEQNAGKRHAQSWAFERSDADVFMTVDSDSYIYPDALRELLKAFNDKEVYAVTGHINARNRDDNLLSRLIDIRYDNAFRVERAAQSVTGNILVCSGPMSAYRREVIIPNLERYKNQTFLGVKVNIGDDRCLTNYAIALGKTAYQSTAFCRTDVPTEIGVFIRQQIRWNKSFFRETLEALKLSWKKPFVGIWSTLELVLWLLLIFSQVQFLIGNFNHFNLKYVFYAFLAVVLSALLRNVHYAVKHPWLFLLSPLYGVLHIFLLQPIRLYALLTMKDVRWGTRKK